ncbi:Stimulated by retinoic acid gene 6 protein like protein [Chelonia mydas]|uniref:Receptor for retinol uptake STRA6 n=1 Tax=Chelonia mydas TaxID=8469 RepID=M7BET7_CHEMY|nr:Stimulated by retinoic acid gene 6 protein like protein [Chelonia mydas]
MANDSSLAAHGSLAYDDFASSDWYMYESMEPEMPQDDPVNFLEAEGHQGLVAAVFGILFSSVCVLVLDTDPLPFIASSSPRSREYWKIMALLYYPAFYYPLIACATIRHRAGYFVGCLLSWCHCVVHIWQKVDCPQSSKVVGNGYYNEYLKTILAKRTHKRSSRKVSLLSRTQMYLRSYIYTPQEGFQVPLKLVLSVTTAVIAVYQMALLLLVVFVPNIQIVRAGMTKEITVLLVQFGIVPSENPGSVPGDMERELDTVRHYLWSLEENPGSVPGDMERELDTVRHYLWSLEVCYVCSLVLSCLLIFSMLMRSLVMHRANLKALYRGAVLDVFCRAQMLCPSQQALVCWMSFASFQTAFACLESAFHCINQPHCRHDVPITTACAFRNICVHVLIKILLVVASLSLILHILQDNAQGVYSAHNSSGDGLLTQQVIFFVCTVGFTFLVVIPLQSGTNMHLFKILENMWPFWLTLVLAVVMQNLLAHFYFLEKHHLQKELTNRRALCIVTYLLFPINVLVGVLAGVWRMFISALYNAVHFCQLDLSLLNRGVEAFDPGYRTYCHYLKIEVSQSHPVMKAFCFLLLQVPGPEGQTGLKPTDVEEGIQLMQPVKGLLKASKSKQTRARWGLAYTLLNNPSLLACRKTVLSDPTANGTQSRPAKP